MMNIFLRDGCGRIRASAICRDSRSALAFCRAAGYRSVMLYTVNALVAASQLYRSTGFKLRSRGKRRRKWGAQVIEEVFDLALK